MSSESDIEKKQYETSVRIHRINWAGLGVTWLEGKERCVPLTDVGQEVEVEWKEDRRGRLTGVKAQSIPSPFEVEPHCRFINQ